MGGCPQPPKTDSLREAEDEGVSSMLGARGFFVAFRVNETRACVSSSSSSFDLIFPPIICLPTPSTVRSRATRCRCARCGAPSCPCSTRRASRSSACSWRRRASRSCRRAARRRSSGPPASQSLTPRPTPARCVRSLLLFFFSSSFFFFFFFAPSSPRSPSSATPPARKGALDTVRVHTLQAVALDGPVVVVVVVELAEPRLAAGRVADARRSLSHGLRN